jgi:hypothetical protein
VFDGRHLPLVLTCIRLRLQCAHFRESRCHLLLHVCTSLAERHDLNACRIAAIDADPESSTRRGHETLLMYLLPRLRCAKIAAPEWIAAGIQSLDARGQGDVVDRGELRSR